MRNPRICYTALLFSAMVFTLASCDLSQHRIDRVASEINHAEKNITQLSEDDWTALDSTMRDLENRLDQDRGSFTEKQIEEIGKLQGRYAALVVKKGIKDIKQELKDAVNQIDGFIEGMTSDSVEQ